MSRRENLQLADYIIVDAGVDWFTTTAVGARDAELLLLRGELITAQERRRGGILKPWKLAGYSGWRCGRCEFGARDDGAIVRVTSSLADSEWWGLWQITERCTRIDLQLTLRFAEDVNQQIDKLSSMVERFYLNRSDGPTLTNWSNNAGGRTMYLGKRSSCLYFRAYNKRAQSNLDAHEGCLRLELEVKQGVCALVIASLLRAETVAQGIQAILAQYLLERGIVSNLAFSDRVSLSETSTFVNDRSRLLRWLETAVRPSVQLLIEDGDLNAVLDVLGLHPFVSER